MVFKINKKISLPDIRVSRVVLVSGLLTFFFCIEFSTGVRVVYITFEKWSSYDVLDKPVSWTLCVGCLFAAVASVMFTNLISAVWEQKQLEEKSKERNVTRFVFHILVGGVLWRYINLWCIETKDYQKTAAVLLTMIKFLFTQLFTIPMVIVHTSVLEKLDELVIDVFIVLCISINLILTCIMFSWCTKEVEGLKKWNYETVDLVPLIFQSEISVPPPSTVSKEDSKNGVKVPVERTNCNSEDLEAVIIKLFVLIQTFGFSFGRLLALGILLKLAGIYAISIMFLQLLISVIYLKFQTPILVSDSLPKWRQLFRLAFMSYILIFEWHLNRDPKFGYDFSSSIKHSVLYYIIATIESIFYLITWNITVNYSNNFEINPRNRFCRDVFIIGSIILIVSLAIHTFLLMWRSRKISRLVHTVRRRYETAKWRLSKYGSGRKVDGNKENKQIKAAVEISNPVPLFKDKDKSEQENKSDLEKQNSYRDLREPLDDEIEIYFRKCEINKKNAAVSYQSARYKNTNDLNESTECVDKKLNEIIQQSSPVNVVEMHAEGKIETESVSPTNDEVINAQKESTITPTDKPLQSALKSKLASFSKNVNEKLSKISAASHDMADNVKEQIHKKKKKLQSFRNQSPSKKEPAVTKPSLKPASTVKPNVEIPDDVQTSEGFIVGDSYSRRKECLQTEKLENEKNDVGFCDIESPQEVALYTTSNSDVPSDEEPAHRTGELPCPCYICRSMGNHGHLRRRSSSVPVSEKIEEREFSLSVPLPRFTSSPNVSETKNTHEQIKSSAKNKEKISSPTVIPRHFLLSLLATEDRVEHYV